jgi:hypothetical protein
VPDGYMERLEEARELIQLAGETPEGRVAARSWLQQVAGAVGADEDQPAPVPDPPTEWRAAQLRAAQALGYENLALSETGPAGIELYPDVRLGHYEDSGLYPGPGQSPDNGGQHMQPYDLGASVQALVDDEIARYSLMAQGGRPARPQYAGIQLSQPTQLEVDDADLIAATMELSARTEGRATFGEVADAADELAGGEPSGRAGALLSLAQRFPGGTSAANELELDLARRREVDRLSTVPPDDPRVLEIIERNPGVLSRAPRTGQRHLSAIEDEDHTDHRQPSRGGEVHPEVDRLLREHGLLLGLDPNTRHPALSARERERAQRRASTRRGLAGMEAMHRQALRSATSSRG